MEYDPAIHLPPPTAPLPPGLMGRGRGTLLWLLTRLAEIGNVLQVALAAFEHGAAGDAAAAGHEPGSAPESVPGSAPSSTPGAIGRVLLRAQQLLMALVARVELEDWSTRAAERGVFTGATVARVAARNLAAMDRWFAEQDAAAAGDAPHPAEEPADEGAAPLRRRRAAAPKPVAVVPGEWHRALADELQGESDAAVVAQIRAHLLEAATALHSPHQAQQIAALTARIAALLAAHPRIEIPPAWTVPQPRAPKAWRVGGPDFDRLPEHMDDVSIGPPSRGPMTFDRAERARRR